MRRLTVLTAGAVLAAVTMGVAFAQDAPPVGATVKDSAGHTVGVIEKVVLVGNQPRQVQIRQGAVVRTLPIRGLTSRDGAYVIVLSKAEFDALPASN